MTFQGQKIVRPVQMNLAVIVGQILGVHSMARHHYLVLSATIFSLVSLAHLLRVIFAWPARLGPIDIPIWLSWLGFIVPALLGIWGFRLARRQRLRQGRGSLLGIDTHVEREDDRI